MYPPDAVEFVGGPFDGYSQSFHAPATALVREAAIPLSECTIRAVTGEHMGPVAPCNRFALYHLERAERGWRYTFQGVVEHSVH